MNKQEEVYKEEADRLIDELIRIFGKYKKMKKKYPEYNRSIPDYMVRQINERIFSKESSIK